MSANRNEIYYVTINTEIRILCMFISHNKKTLKQRPKIHCFSMKSFHMTNNSWTPFSCQKIQFLAIYSTSGLLLDTTRRDVWKYQSMIVYMTICLQNIAVIECIDCLTKSCKFDLWSTTYVGWIEYRIHNNPPIFW